MASPDLRQVLEAALRHYNRSELEQAAALCGQALAADAGNDDALHLLALIARQQGRPEAAVDLMRQAIVRAPSRPELHRNLALLYQSLGRVDDALASAHRAAELDPAGAAERGDLRVAIEHAVRAAAEHLRRGEHGRTQTLCRRVLDIDPDQVDALHLLGLVHGESGDREQALDLIGRAIALKPDLPYLHANRGLLCERMGRHADAVQHYEALVRLTPGPDAWSRLGDACKRAGRRYDAILAWERAWAQRPEDGRLYMQIWGAYQELGVRDLPPGRQAESYIGAVACGNSARIQGQADAAESLYRTALALRPEAPHARSQLGALLAAARRYGEADECFRRLAEKYPYPNAMIRFDAGYVAALEDRHRDARYPPLQGAPGVTDKPVVVVIGGGTDYFRTYAWPLIHSVLRNGGLDCLIHVHVVNPDEFIPEEIESLRRELACPDLAYTFEHKAFLPGSEKERLDGTYSVRTYLSCSRFLRLPELLRHYGRPLLMLDLDVLVLKDLKPLLAATAPVDGGLIDLGRNTQNVWDQVYATLIAIQPTARARAFVDRVADYVWSHVANDRLYWGIEQVAWYAVTAALDGTPHAPQFHAFSPRIVQGAAFFRPGQTEPEYAEDAFIWTITASMGQNRAKLELPEYRRFLPPARLALGWYLPGTDREIRQALERAPAREGRKLWKPDAYRAVLEKLPAGRRRRALDIGAHAGMWSWMLCEGFERVEAFEADPLLQECWRRNVVGPNAVLHGAVESLDVLRFDRVDLVRVSAEGEEERVLQGARDTLLGNRPLVLVEPGYSDLRRRVNDSAAARYLAGMGARVLSSTEGGGVLMGW